jgi:hypothetical protein
VLALDIKALIVVTMTAGETWPSSNKGGLGLGRMKLFGSRRVGLTVSEILLPAVVKKLLNLFAVDVFSVIFLPFMVIESILLELDLVLIASFSMSQVFFRIFSMVFKIGFKVMFFALVEHRIIHITVGPILGNIKLTRIDE